MASPKLLYAIIVVLLAGLLISSSIAALYVFQYDQAQSSASTYLSELKSAHPMQLTNILLDYGNGTDVWYNDTQVPAGTNAYLATVLVTRGQINATWDAQYGEHLVNGIENLQNTQQQSWFIWTYNATSRWQVAQVGADDLPVSNGSVFAWTYCSYSSSTYLPTCTP